MKHFIFSAILILVGLFGHAQTTTLLFSDSEDQKTLEFYGIPIKGTIQEYFNKLVAKGFEPFSATTNKILTGEFIGESCTVILSGDDDLISSISIRTNREYNNWHDIYSAYNRIIKLYNEKYGAAFTSNEEFYYPFEKGDGYEFTAIKSDKCDISTIWSISDNSGNRYGIIGISITDEAKIFITYVNMNNQEIIDKQEKESYLDEI